MRNLLFILFFFSSFLLSAQDTIYFKNGDRLAVSILEKGNKFTVFKLSESKKSPEISVWSYTIEKIKEADKAEVFYFNDHELITPKKPLTDEELFDLGKRGANKNFRRHHSANIVVATTTMLASPIIGGIPAFIYATRTPKQKHWKHENSKHMRHVAYIEGYGKKSKEIRLVGVLATWTVTSVVWITGAALILSDTIPVDF